MVIIILMDIEPFVTGTYLVCSILFILALGGLSSPETSKRGNWFGMIAMLLSIISTIFENGFHENFASFFPAIAVGAVIGTIMALKVIMTSMPKMVAALHSFVGLAATLVAFSNFFHEDGKKIPAIESIETIIGVFIGAVTFTGSIVACGKLQEWISSEPLIIGGSFRHVLNMSLIIGCIVLGVLFGIEEDELIQCFFLIAIAVLAGFLGWHLVMAIGGADMPVVVSMLNSYSGWATAASGFLLKNWLLLVTGALVGSSGAILSYIMCRAMNRSFVSVIAGGFGASYEQDPTKISDVVAETIDIAGVADLLRKSKSIVIVPGYGMALSRCQHVVAELTTFLLKSGRRVQFCIHPVAGRLPGHMNVLLAEADVDYKLVKEMDEVNEHFKETDLVLIIGANDTVNPDAIENPRCNIAGMPVCHVWEAKNVVVFKRGASGQGYSKTDNPLFIKPNTKMCYGNAAQTLPQLFAEAKSEKYNFGSDGVIQEEEEIVEESAEELLKDLPHGSMTIGVPREIAHLERRVAMTPSMVPKFRKLGFEVRVQKGAGLGANFSDQMYETYGAEVCKSSQVWRSDIILKVKRVEQSEEKKLKHPRMVISYVNPSMYVEWLEDIAKRFPDLTYLAMDQVPRISRAQKLDSLSSMANVGGYRAVMEAFQAFQKCPKPMITAAGKLPPAQVLVMGAGVAGLAAIGYCKNLGCLVKAMDTRSAAKEDAESMGAKFLEVSIKEDGTTAGGYSKQMSEEYLNAQKELTKNTAKSVDIIITTALIPGRKAPILLDDGVVRAMRPGSVIVDMAAEMGGNCALTQPDQAIVTENGVTVIGYTDLTSRMAPQSSELYANNLFNLLTDMGGANKFEINIQDEVIGAMTVIHKGQKCWYNRGPPPPPAQVVKPPEVPAQQAIEHIRKRPSFYSKIDFLVVSIILLLVFVGISYAMSGDESSNEKNSFMNLLMIFVMAIFIGYMVIWNVTPALHTPLMSVTNAISGIIVIGAMLLLSPNHSDEEYDQGSIIGILSVFFASINIFGGFIVTYRILDMFKTNIPNN